MVMMMMIMMMELSCGSLLFADRTPQQSAHSSTFSLVFLLADKNVREYNNL